MTRGRALLLTPRYASFATNGAGQRTQLMARALARRFKLDVVSPGMNDNPGVVGAFPFAADIREPVFAPEAGPADAYREDEATRRSVGDPGAYDLILSRYLGPAAKAGVLREGEGAPPVVLDLDDRDDLVAEGARRAAATAAMARLLPKAAHVLVTAEEERAGLGDQFGHPPVSVLENAVFDMPPEALPPARGPVLLFVGTARHEPNLRGMRAFLSGVWPLIHAALPDAVVEIAGAGWESALPASLAAAPGIRLLGFVEDLPAAYARAAFVLCPLTTGGGTKIKVAEALVHGRCVLADPHSARGYEDAIGAGAVVTAAGARETAQAAIALLASGEGLAERAAAGRAYAEKAHGPDAFMDKLLRACEAAMAFRAATGHKRRD